MVGKTALGYVRIDTPGERRLFWLFFVLPLLSALFGTLANGLWYGLGVFLGAVIFAIILTHIVSSGLRIAGRAVRSGVRRARRSA